MRLLDSSVYVVRNISTALPQNGIVNLVAHIIGYGTEYAEKQSTHRLEAV